MINQEIQLQAFLQVQPANIAFAKQHGSASMIGLPEPDSQTCPCCDKSIQKKPIHFLAPSEYLDVLGRGVKLYFYFLSFQLVLFIVMCLSYTLPSMFIRYYSLGPKGHPLAALGFWQYRDDLGIKIQSYINLCSIVIWWLLYYILRLKSQYLTITKHIYLQNKLYQRVNKEMIKTIVCRQYDIKTRLKQSDYCLLLKLPTKLYSKYDIYHSIDQLMNRIVYDDRKRINPIFENSFPINNVFILDDSRQIFRLTQIYHDCQQLILNTSKEQKSFIQFLQQNKINSKKLLTQIKNQQIQQSKYTIVRFKYSCQKNIILQFIRIGYHLMLQQEPIQIYQIPDQTLRWDNIGLDPITKNTHQILVVIIAITICIIFIGINFGLILLYIQIVQNGISGYIVFLYPAFIAIQLFLIRIYFRYCLPFQHCLTKQQEWIKSLYKQVPIQTLFTIISLVLPFLTLQNQPFIHYGIHQTLMFWTGLMFILSICNFFRYQTISKYLYQALAESNRGNGYNQRTANQLFEGQNFNPKQICTWWLCWSITAYALGPIFPLLYLSALISGAVIYCSQKYNFCYNYSQPYNFNSHYIQACIFLIKLGIFVHSITSLVLRYPYIRKYNNEDFQAINLAFDISGLILSFILILIPWKYLVRQVLNSDQSTLMQLGPQIQNYKFDRKSIVTTNPIQSKKNMARKITKKKKKTNQTQKDTQVMMVHNNVISILDQYQVQKGQQINTPRLQQEKHDFLNQSSSYPLLKRQTISMKPMPKRNNKNKKDRSKLYQED